MKLIDKDKVVAELERRVEAIRKAFNEPGILSGVDRTYANAQYDAFKSLLTFLDTLEVKEIYEHNDSDLDPILEEIGVESDSKLAKMFRTAFYKSIDTYLAKNRRIAMKAGELMISDWIFDGDNVAQVTSITCDGIIETTFNETSNIEVIHPIPLTPEILEKNGFYYGYTSNEYDIASNTIAQLDPEDKGWVWDDGDGSVKVIFPKEADGGMIAIDDQGFDRHLDLVFCGCIFVHELQHALRLCGIDKEIVL